MRMARRVLLLPWLAASVACQLPSIAPGTITCTPGGAACPNGLSCLSAGDGGEYFCETRAGGGSSGGSTGASSSGGTTSGFPTFVQDGQAYELGGSAEGQIVVLPSAVGAGDLLAVAVRQGEQGAVPVVSDSLGNSYIREDLLTTGDNALYGGMATFYAINRDSGTDIVNLAVLAPPDGGPISIADVCLYVADYADFKVGPLLGHAIGLPMNVPAGPNQVQEDVTKAPGAHFIWAFSFGTGTLTAGTGFTPRGPDGGGVWGQTACPEDGPAADGTTQLATWTSSAGGDFFTAMLVF